MKKIFSNNYLTFCIYALIGWLYEVLWLWFVVPPKQFVNRGVLIGPFLPIYGFGMLILLVCLKKYQAKSHEIKEIKNMVLATSIITTFIYTTIIEYTTPKIYSVLDYLKQYGLGLIITNVIVFVITYLLVKKTKNKSLKKLDTTIVLVFLWIWLITTGIEYISHFVIDTFFHISLWDYTKDFLNINARVNWDASRNFAIGGTFLLYTVQPLINKLLIKLKERDKLLITIIIGVPMLLDFIFHVVLKII